MRQSALDILKNDSGFRFKPMQLHCTKKPSWLCATTDYNYIRMNFCMEIFTLSYENSNAVTHMRNSGLNIMQLSITQKWKYPIRSICILAHENDWCLNIILRNTFVFYYKEETPNNPFTKNHFLYRKQTVLYRSLETLKKKKR